MRASPNAPFYDNPSPRPDLSWTRLFPRAFTVLCTLYVYTAYWLGKVDLLLARGARIFFGTKGQFYGLDLCISSRTHHCSAILPFIGSPFRIGAAGLSPVEISSLGDIFCRCSTTQLHHDEPGSCQSVSIGLPTPTTAPLRLYICLYAVVDQRAYTLSPFYTSFIASKKKKKTRVSL